MQDVVLTIGFVERGLSTGSTLENRALSVRMFDDCQNGVVASKLSTLLMSQPLNHLLQDNLDATKTIPNLWPMQLSLGTTDILFFYILTRLMKYTAHCLSVTVKVLVHAFMPKSNRIRQGQGAELMLFKVKPNDQDDIKCILNQVSYMYNNCKITTFQGCLSFAGCDTWEFKNLKLTRMVKQSSHSHVLVSMHFKHWISHETNWYCQFVFRSVANLL